MVKMESKDTLSAVYAMTLSGKRPTRRALSARLGLTERELGRRLDGLRSAGLVLEGRGKVWLTPLGRSKIKVVFMGGGFEVLHAGHIYTIDRAKRLGDALVVVLATDDRIRRRKGREPVSSEKERLAMVSGLRQVDAAIVGGEGSIYETLERVRPDVVALGYDQHHGEKEIREEARKRGMALEVVRLGSPFPLTKTTRILQDI